MPKEADVIYLWIVLGVAAGIVAALFLFILIMGMLGKNIPEEHEATSVINIHAPAEKVFDAIADIQNHLAWSPGVTRVDPLPDQNGMQAVRMRTGRNSFVLVRTRFEPPTLLERTITDDHHAFDGTWLYKVKPAGDASGTPVCRVSLKETGRVKWPAARAMMKHLFGYHANTHRHLRALAGKFEPHPGKPHRA